MYLFYLFISLFSYLFVLIDLFIWFVDLYTNIYIYVWLSQDSLGVLDGSALLELRFGAASGSVLCSLAMAAEGVAREMQSFRAVFSVAIRDAWDVGESQFWGPRHGKMNGNYRI